MILFKMIEITEEAMRLAIASTIRSYKQVMILFNIDIENITLPMKTVEGKIIVSGGNIIERKYIVQKKIGKLNSYETNNVFKVKFYQCK